MKTRISFFLCAMLAVTLAFPVQPVLAESPESAYKAGARAEKKNDYDFAFQAYKRAHDARPNDPKYMTAYLRMRFYASGIHLHRGQELSDAGKFEEALAEYRMAAQIDPSNFEAQGRIRRVVDQMQRQAAERENAARLKSSNTFLEKEAAAAAGPAQLEIKWDMPVSLHLTAATDVVYKTLGKIAGLNVLLDPEYKPQKITFELKDVTLRDALSMVALQSKTFWRPVSSNTILVTSDSGSKRKELEQNVMKTFYLRNAATSADLQQAAGTLKGILDISHIQVTPEQRSLTIRGTPDQMVLAQKLLADIDKPKAEVLIDVAVMEVNRDRVRTIGTNPPTGTTVTVSPAGSSSTSGTSGTLTLSSLTSLTSNDFSISAPSASFSLLATDSHSKVIQRPEIRAMDGEKASLKIGDRVPIATGSYQSGLGGSVNTQFQYLDVGVNIDITPYVHADNEVTLKMSLEISSVASVQNVDGFSEPTIGQRRIEHEARLADGEVNLIGGILNDTDTQSLSGYPWVSKIPILKYLFAQESKERQQSEIVFAITPHIIRSNQVTDDNLRMVDLGSGSSVTYRKVDAKPEAASAPAPPPGNSPPPADTRSQNVALPPSKMRLP